LINIKDITLLIIDECHHTVKKDPYNNIMGIYLDERLESKQGNIKLPQVIVLFACKHFFQLCSILQQIRIGKLESTLVLDTLLESS